MRWFTQLAVARKIALVSSSMLVLFGLAVAVGVSKSSLADEKRKQVIELQTWADTAKSFVFQMQLQRTLQSEFSIVKDPALLERFEASATDAFAAADGLAARFPDSPEIQQAVSRARKLDEIHDPLVLEKIVPAVRAGDTATVERLIPRASALVEQFVVEGNRAGKAVDEQVAAKQAELETALNETRMYLIGLGIMALILGTALSLVLARQIVSPLRTLRDRIRHIGQTGALGARVDASVGGEIGEVSTALNTMLGEFEVIVAGMTTHSRELALAAAGMSESADEARGSVGEIAATMEAIASGASHQAETAQQISEVMNEIADGVTQVAERGQAASDAADTADSTAATGAKALIDTSSAMKEIERSVAAASEVVTSLGDKSQRIGEIVSTISEISSQTNLLALNAAIEAARAGHQGRGFAVVADEVRKLAEESATAATSIAEIVQDIQGESQRAIDAMDAGREAVTAGGIRVEATAEAFAAIRDQVANVTGEVTQVAATVKELRTGTAEAQTGMETMAAVAQQNAAAAEQVSASTTESTASVDRVTVTSGEVAQAAGKIDQMVGRFSTSA